MPKNTNALIRKKVSGACQCPFEIPKLTAGDGVLYFFCIHSL